MGLAVASVPVLLGKSLCLGNVVANEDRSLHALTLLPGPEAAVFAVTLEMHFQAGQVPMSKVVRACRFLGPDSWISATANLSTLLAAH